VDASQFAAPDWGRVISTLGPASYQAFVPAKVPKELTLTAEIIMKLSDADAALGRSLVPVGCFPTRTCW
jgi:hypothetical protein